MTDDIRPRTGRWPHGPFLVLPDPDEKPPADSVVPDEPSVPPAPTAPPAAADTESDTKPVKKTAPEPETAGESGTKADTGPDTGTTKKASEKAPEGRPAKLFKKGEDEDDPDGDDAEDDDTAAGEGPETIAAGKADAPAPAAPAAEGQEDDRSIVARVRRRAALLRQGDRYARRRMLAAKYATGVVIGWGFGVNQWAHDALVRAHQDPGTAVCLLAASAGAYSAWTFTGKMQGILQPVFSSIGQLFSGIGRIFSVIPVLGPLVDFTVNTWNAIFAHYVPFRVIASAVGGYFAFPFGYVAVGYAQSKGIDTTTLTPHMVGLAATGALWFVIDRRTEAFAQHLPGHVFHWATCTLTGTVGLTTALYTTS
ncbi:hypothetical protein [Streptomyces violaceusniger]|uniref:Uncharacterized protein n=1 Tax=Streptomyces violaceusniger (strain Tu 4113) TaxID=653045 RepID=G2PHM8_STRV4|nr:hypothetical protein [Streptomyces violaceusniger]AEM88829.1 hypothetical protein Strvi_0052 [Streptomyces violaceusniger Tu 4113]